MPQVFHPAVYACMMLALPTTNSVYYQLEAGVPRYSLRLHDEQMRPGPAVRTPDRGVRQHPYEPGVLTLHYATRRPCM